ncbi:MAG: flagellar biosynthesis protein FliQ [Planctomycetaceae bacterium]|nr:flagellar biosynthesis protein FliQ [Planctomycetaceae bacterium]
MQTTEAIDLVREAIRIMLLISAPALATGLLIGLVVGLLQALTQVQEQAISFVTKLVGTILALTLTLPWILTQFLDYTRELFQAIPGSL